LINGIAGDGIRAAEAVAALDARFPWLRGAEKRDATRRRPAQPTGDDRRVA
jgi:hypothetical protein